MHNGSVTLGRERARLLTKVKELFLSCCAAATGMETTTQDGCALSERGLSGHVIARAVNGRPARWADEGSDAQSRSTFSA